MPKRRILSKPRVIVDGIVASAGCLSLGLRVRCGTGLLVDLFNRNAIIHISIVLGTGLELVRIRIRVRLQQVLFVLVSFAVAVVFPLLMRERLCYGTIGMGAGLVSLANFSEVDCLDITRLHHDC